MTNDLTANSRFERICLYVDDEMSSAERKQFEQEMSTDPVLRAEIAELIRIKTAVSTLPEIETPRNFLLNPTDYHKNPVAVPVVAEPQKSGFPSWILAGLLGALMVSFLFVFINGGGFGLGDDAQVAMESAAESVADTASDASASAAIEVEEAVEEVMEESADEAFAMAEPEVEVVQLETVVVEKVEVVREADVADDAMMDELAETESESAVSATAADNAGDAAAAEMVEEAPPPMSPAVLPTSILSPQLTSSPWPTQTLLATPEANVSQQSAPYPEPTSLPTTATPFATPADDSDSVTDEKFLSGFPANGKTLCDNQTQIELLDSVERRISFGTLDTCQPVTVLEYVWLGEIGVGLYQIEVPAGSVVHISDDEAIALDLPMIGWVEDQFIEEN